ncbi:FUSC family protein [Rhodopseudomonas parapalustris]
MLVTMSPAKPFRIAGFALRDWGFALRIWAAMMISLYIAFWLQLEGAASAATCVGILALPTRGHALEKAFWRLFGTAVGVVVSIAITGAFNEIRELMFLSYAIWLGICTYIASHFEGNRAYGAVLSGYTVAIVAIAQIDAPDKVFMAGMNRGAAIFVAIVVVTVINDILAAPDLSTLVGEKLARARMQVTEFAATTITKGTTTASDVGNLLQTVTAIRTDIDAVAAEGLSGGRRAAAAAAAVSALVQQTNMARAVAVAIDDLGNIGAEQREKLVASMKGSDHQAATELRNKLRSVERAPDSPTGHLLAASGVTLLLECERQGALTISDLRSGRGRRESSDLPIFRCRASALRNALRVFCVVLVVGALLSLTNWPAVSAVLIPATALAAMSSSTPDPLGFVKGACIMAVLAAVLVGITKFVLLSGADAFPLLAISMAPLVMAGALLLTIPKPSAFLLGFLTVALSPGLMNPQNPEDYSALGFLVNTMLTLGGFFILLPALSLLLPTTDRHRRRWLLESAETDCRDAFAGRGKSDNSPEMSFRDASRIAQFGRLKLPDPARREADMGKLCRLADLSYAARRCRALIAQIGQRPHDELPIDVRRAIGRLDATALRLAGDHFIRGRPDDRSRDHSGVLRLGLALVWLAGLIERSPGETAKLRDALS